MRLGVNIDHVATLREARKINEPDPVQIVGLVEMAGADGIVCHLREDRRHLQDRDLELLRKVVKTHLNLEMAATDEMVEIACQTGPDMVTLVPEKREEVTTEGGLDVTKFRENIQEKTKILKASGIVVSLFIDPDLEQIKAARNLGADFVELHTGEYANAGTEQIMQEELEKIRSMSVAARKLGLRVSAGHGLNHFNVSPIASIPEVEELNIGHSLIGRALFVGISESVRTMKELINQAREQ
jgi:pyridoxine 5-phosphate synthase